VFQFFGNRTILSLELLVVEQMYHLQISAMAFSEYPCSLNTLANDDVDVILRQTLLRTVKVAANTDECWAFPAITVMLPLARSANLKNSSPKPRSRFSRKICLFGWFSDCWFQLEFLSQKLYFLNGVLGY
jgi:hypothetical protein